MKEAPQVVRPWTEFIGEERERPLRRSDVTCGLLPAWALPPPNGRQGGVKIRHLLGESMSQAAPEVDIERLRRAIERACPAPPVIIDEIGRRPRALDQGRALVGQRYGGLGDETKLSQRTEMRAEHALRALVDE
jgi:hypothetical protein